MREAGVTLERARRSGVLLVVVVAVAGLALREWVRRSPLGVLDSDEAVGLLIGRHLLDGEFPVFLWANVHGGTLEAFPSAVLFWLFGSSAFLGKLVVVALFAGACGLTYLLGREMATARAGRVAAALMWLYPGAVVLLSVKARLYYGATLVLAAATLLLCNRLSRRLPRRELLVLGLVAGLGLWASPFYFYVAVPAGLWLAVRRRREWRSFVLVLPGLVVGGAPWLAYNVRHSLDSLDEPAVPVSTTYADRLEGFFTQLLPKATGFQWSASGQWVLGGGGRFLYVAFLGLLMVIAVRQWRRFSLLVVVLAAYPFLFAVPASSHYVAEPRYGLFLVPVVAVLVGWALTSLLDRLPASLAVEAALYGVAVVLSVVGLRAVEDFTDRFPGQHDVAALPLSPLARELRADGVRYVFADYWIAYRLSFETEEDVVATSMDLVRYEPFDEEVRSRRSRTYVVHAEMAKDAALRRALESQGVGFRRQTVGGFAVFTLDEYHPPADFPEVRGLP